jgi:hypothetical protein
MANIPIYIPTYINSAEYTPVNVQPRLLFFNGMIDCEKYYIESASAFGGISREQNAFPYFDNYNVVTGSFPTVDSNSLLFFNEEAVYGEKPNESLYSEYWEKYVELIYNPRTKLLNASAIIPLSDYFDMELNDIVEFRSNYYHLRAINDYSLKNGECSIQLLGPILDDSLIIPRLYYERCMGYSIDNCNDSCTDYYNNCAQFLYEYCLGYSTFNCIEACDDFGNCPTTTTTTTAAPNCDYSSLNVICNDVTTTTSTTTSTTTTSTTTTTAAPTTTTSTSTSTTTTTIPPGPYYYRASTVCEGGSISTYGIQTDDFISFDNFARVAVLYAEGSTIFTGDRCFTIFGDQPPIPPPATTFVNVLGLYTSSFDANQACADCYAALLPQNLAIEYVIVGAGGEGYAGGGGGGQFLTGSTIIATNSTLPIVAGKITNLTPARTQVSGANSSFLGLTSIGGGNGGGPASVGEIGRGWDGACGGGGGANDAFAGGTGSFGFNGGAGATPGIGGGGGGVAAAGGDGNDVLPSSIEGVGGIGKQWLDGEWYCGGGNANVAFPGPNYPAVSGSSPSPGGGGHEGFGPSGPGMIKVRYSDTASAIVSGGTITSTSGFVYHTFTGSLQTTTGSLIITKP